MGAALATGWISFILSFIGLKFSDFIDGRLGGERQERRKPMQRPSREDSP